MNRGAANGRPRPHRARCHDAGRVLRVALATMMDAGEAQRYGVFRLRWHTDHADEHLRMDERRDTCPVVAGQLRERSSMAP